MYHSALHNIASLNTETRISRGIVLHMRNKITIVAIALTLADLWLGGVSSQPVFAQEEAPRWSIAIHGGAGTLDPDRMTPERRAAYEAALQEALDAGSAILADGGSAMDAILFRPRSFRWRTIRCLTLGAERCSHGRGATNSMPPSWTVAIAVRVR